MDCQLMSKQCLTYDNYYGNRMKLGVFESHIVCMKNQYNSKTNPNGFVNFGTSVNAVIAHTTIKYLPEFMKLEDCPYPDPRGYDQINKKVCEGTKFLWNETFSFNSIYSILSLCCFGYKKVFVIGKSDKINMEIVLDHSQSQLVQKQQNASLVILFNHSKEIIQSVEQKNPNSVKLFIISSKQELNNFDIHKSNQVFGYQNCLKQGLNLAAIHTKDPKIKNKIIEEWAFFTTSTVTRRAILTPDLKVQIQLAGTETIRKMIQTDSNVIVPEDKIWLTTGGSSSLDNISRAIFKNCNIGVDAPYYVGFDVDLTHFGAKIVSKPIIGEKKLFDLIKQFQSEGCKGFIICNPNNPVGKILLPQEVDQICLWAKNKPEFHIIFDEMYLNTCIEKQTKSAAGYAISMPNIHVARGMAKDFGLCGFKVGFAISSNPIVMKKFEEWKPIISHHPFTISVINSMLKKSNYGTDIINFGKKLLKNYFELVCGLLDKQNISYLKPQAGCFIFANFSEFLRNQSLDSEYILWKKLFYKYRVNLANGANYHTPTYGYFRICPIVGEEIMQVGLRRIIACLRANEDQEQAKQQF